MSEPYTKWRYSYSGADVRVTAWFPHQAEAFGSSHQALITALHNRQNAIEQQQIDLQIAQAAIQDRNADAAADFLARAQSLDTTITYHEEAAQSAATEISNKGPQPLESIHTVSISVHEPKGPARALGYRGIKGFASSVRTIAGSMIFTVVEGHPLEVLMLRDIKGTKIPWSHDYANGAKGVGAIAGSSAYAAEERTDIKLATLLSPFDMMMIYTSEIPRTITKSESYTTLSSPAITESSDASFKFATESATFGIQPTFGIQDVSTTNTLKGDRDIGTNLLGTTNSAALMLKGVRFMTEGIVTSVNDMVTEIVYQFVAEDMVELSQHHFGTKPLQQLTSTEQGIVMASYTETHEDLLYNAPPPEPPYKLGDGPLTLGETAVFIETEPSAATFDFSLGDDYSLFPDNLSMDRHIRGVGALGMGPFKGGGN